MTTARDAGAAFFENVLRKGDKAFLVAFGSQPHIVQKWSPELKEIYSGLAKMRAEEVPRSRARSVANSRFSSVETMKPPLAACRGRVRKRVSNHRASRGPGTAVQRQTDMRGGTATASVHGATLLPLLTSHRCRFCLRVVDEPGQIVDEDGLVVGRHDGVWGFTPGQRRGLRLAGAVTAVDDGRPSPRTQRERRDDRHRILPREA